MRHPCQKTVATRGAGLAALLLLAVGMARAEDGVLAEFAFLDEIPEWGPVGESHVAIDLAGDSARPFALLLDTGAGYSMLTPRYARQVGVNIRRLKDTFYRRSTVLGRDLQFVVDTRSSDTAARTFEAGLVGGNFLTRIIHEPVQIRDATDGIEPDRCRCWRGPSAGGLRESTKPAVVVFRARTSGRVSARKCKRWQSERGAPSPVRD